MAALGYAALTVSQNFARYRHPVGGWLVLGVMTAWTAFTVLRFPPDARRRPGLLTADLCVTAACVLATLWAERSARLVEGEPPIAVMWMGACVLVWAIAFGRRGGLLAGGVIGLCNLAVHAPFSAYSFSQLTFAPGLLLLTGAALGHLARLAVRAQEALDRGARIEAAARERDRLARGIHDSVLQVLCPRPARRASPRVAKRRSWAGLPGSRRRRCGRWSAWDPRMRMTGTPGSAGSLTFAP